MASKILCFPGLMGAAWQPIRLFRFGVGRSPNRTLKYRELVLTACFGRVGLLDRSAKAVSYQIVPRVLILGLPPRVELRAATQAAAQVPITLVFSGQHE
jgi:hypothetical protein